MALKAKPGGSAVRELKVGKPVISTDIMGNRNIEVRPVGAWVQPEADSTGYEQQHGVISAKQEENRIRRNQMEKEQRLKQFQRDVKQRVKALDRAKKEKLIAKSVKEMEVERNILKQSAFARGHATSRIDNCSLHKQANVVIHSPRSNTIKDHRGDNKKPAPVFVSQNDQSHTVVNRARKNLISRQIVDEDVADRTDDKILNNRRNPIFQKDRLKSEDYTDHNTGLSNDKVDNDLRGDPLIKNVHFDLRPLSASLDSEEVTEKVMRPGSRRTRCKNVPEIYLGVLSEEEKKKKQVQHAMYRRLFMDLEREQVKENLRRKEHRKNIARLKKEKEESRKEEENEARYLVEPRDPITGETEKEVLDRELTEQINLRTAMILEQERQRKARESERYLDALKYRLRERIAERDIQLPPLCCCGVSIWDTNPDTCANNCVFYKNPKGYARALQALLSSFDVL